MPAKRSVMKGRDFDTFDTILNYAFIAVDIAIIVAIVVLFCQVEDLLEGKEIKKPVSTKTTFKTAQKTKLADGKQEEIF